MSNCGCGKQFIIQQSITITKGDKGDKGDPGSGTTITLPLNSDDVEYAGQTLTEVLDALTYIALTINSFSASQSIYEIGQVLTSINLSWTYNKSVQTQTITGSGVVSPSLTVGERTKTVTLNNLASNTVVTLTADDVTGDGNAAKTATITVQFLNKIYWGKATIPGAVNSAFILGLSNSNLQAVRQTTFSLSPSTNEYIWFAIPSTYGNPSFKTNGFDGGISFVSTISLTNASGHTENYDVYRSDNPNLGLTSVQVL